MILTYKDIHNFDISYLKKLKYSKSFTFIPIHIQQNKQICLLQTPTLYIPYGIQKLQNNKEILDISFMNISNDQTSSLFLQFMEKIILEVTQKFNIYSVQSFLKDTPFNKCMRLKIDKPVYFNHHKQRISSIESHTYGSFLIQLHGLWINNNKIWFQWYLLQGKIERPSFLKEYAFIEDKEDKEDKEEKEDKYEKMKSMGVPLGAIEIQKNLDNNLNNNLNKNLTPPPPPPLPNFKRSLPISKIKASDLQSVVLKKSKKIERKKIYSKTGFEPPSIEELQTTLSKLKKIL